MELKLIEELLNKYYKGDTSVEEENHLKVFFEQGNVPDYLKIEQLKFNFYRHTLKEGSETEISIENLEKREVKTIRMTPHLKVISGIAASILLIVGTYFLLNKNPNYSESELAYKETKKALLLVSEKLNKGTKNLNKLSKLNETQILLTK